MDPMGLDLFAGGDADPRTYQARIVAKADAMFDGTLKQALALKLEESTFLNVFPEQQVRETLTFMRRDNLIHVGCLIEAQRRAEAPPSKAPTSTSP